MSSMRNAVQRRNHRERAQPLERQKWGLLEKSKDYKLRAADHKTKKRKLKALQQKVAERNEDEFYFAMVNNQSRAGVKLAKRGVENSGGGGQVLSADVIKLMKTQDVGYLRTALQQTKKEREKLEQDVVGADFGVRIERAKMPGAKLAFDEEKEKASSKTSRHVEEPGDMDDRFSAEDDSAVDEATNEVLGPEDQRKQRQREVRRRKLQALHERERDLALALDQAEEQRAKMNGNAGGVNKKGVMFKVRHRKS